MAPTTKEGKRRYKCGGNAMVRVCPAPAFVTEAHLVPVVERALFERVDELVAKSAGDRAEIDRLTAARDRAHRLLLAYRDDPEIGEVLGHAVWKDGLRVRQAALDQADAELRAAIIRRSDGLPDAAALRTAWGEMDSETRRRILGAVFDAIVVRKHPSRAERLPIHQRVRLLARGDLAAFDVPRSSRTPAALLPPFEWLSDPAGPWIALREPVLEDRRDGA